MLALWIILGLLLLFLLLPVGVDAAYLDRVFHLKVKFGPFQVPVLPKKTGGGEAKPAKPKKKKKKKRKKKKKPQAGEAQDQTGKKRRRRLPRVEEVLELVRIVLKMLSQFRRHLSIDRLTLHLLVAAPDPFDAVTRYGQLNAALWGLSPLMHRALKIRREDIQTGLDPVPGKTAVEGQLVATLRVWQIFHLGFSTGFSFIVWFVRRKKAAQKREKMEKQADRVDQAEQERP